MQIQLTLIISEGHLSQPQNLLGSQVSLVVKRTCLPMQEMRDAGSIPGSRKSPGGAHGNAFQYLCLENPGAEEPGGLQTLGHTESDSTETT